MLYKTLGTPDQLWQVQSANFWISVIIEYFITMSRHQHEYFWPSLATPSLSFIAPGRSSGLHPVSTLSGIHPVSAQSCCMYVRAGRPAFARRYEGVHRSTSLWSSSQLLQQCPACPVRQTLIVFVTSGGWPYSCCFVGFCLQDLF